MTSGPGGPSQAPVAPYRFIEEHANGSQPCVSVHDANGRRWRVKWGHEVQPETLAVRLAWACGYFAEVTHFVASGTIEGAPRAGARGVVPGSRRAASSTRGSSSTIRPSRSCSRSTAGRGPTTRSSARASSPGSKVVLMLISNWDNKDQRDVARGSNTAIYVTRVSRWKREAQYLIVDWGGSMGRWGGTIVTRGRWDPAGFAAQTPQFVTGVANGFVQFGYTGQRTADARGRASAWTTSRGCAAIWAASPTPSSAPPSTPAARRRRKRTSFAASLRDRIEQLRRVRPGVRSANGRTPGSGLET